MNQHLPYRISILIQRNDNDRSTLVQTVENIIEEKKGGGESNNDARVQVIIIPLTITIAVAAFDRMARNAKWTCTYARIYVAQYACRANGQPEMVETRLCTVRLIAPVSLSIVRTLMHGTN